MFHPLYFDTVRETVEKLTELRKEYPFHMTINKIQEPPLFNSLDSRYTPEHFKWAEEAQQTFDQIASEGPEVRHDRAKEFGRSHFFTEKKVGGNIERKEYKSYAELDKDTKANFSGMYCSAGTMFMRICTDGTVQGTSCPIVPKAKNINIYEENPFEKDDWMHCFPCTRTWCSDVANRRIAKFHSKEDANNYIEECKRKQKSMSK